MSDNNGIPEGVPQASIEIGGREFPLVYTLGTALRLRRELRKAGIDADEHDAMVEADEAEVALLTIWAMAAHGDHSGMTPEQFADLIPMEEIHSVMNTVRQVKEDSAPVADEESGAEGEAGARRTEGKAETQG